MKYKLFCLPYAGGSAAVYLKWKKYLKNSVQLCPIELPGRGSRNKISYAENLQEAVEDICGSMENEIEENEYAIFGHSFGSVLAYEVCRKLQELQRKEPSHVFFSGRYPPSIETEKRNLHLLPYHDFLKEALKLGGVPKNLLRYEALLKASMETLRADYKILETYEHPSTIYKLNCNISILSGKEDSLAKPSDMKGWSIHGEKKCTFYVFEGGHFYIHDNAVNITQIINNTLED